MAISVIQGVLEAKHGVIGEVVPSLAVAESLRIADEFVKQWFGETEVQKVEQAVEQKVSASELSDDELDDAVFDFLYEQGVRGWDKYGNIYVTKQELVDLAKHFSKPSKQEDSKQIITKEAFSAITDILRTKYGLDDLDVVEFAMETERKLQIQIPDDWFGCGRVHTVHKSEKPACSIHRATLDGDRIIPCGDCEDKFTCDKIK